MNNSIKIKVLCKRLDVIHISGIQSYRNDIISLKDGKSFISIPLNEHAVYQSTTQISKAGIVRNETITAKMKYSSPFYLFDQPLYYYILKLYTDSESFIVGSLEYPAELTQNTDKLLLNLTFKSSNPVI